MHKILIHPDHEKLLLVRCWHGEPVIRRHQLHRPLNERIGLQPAWQMRVNTAEERLAQVRRGIDREGGWRRIIKPERRGLDRRGDDYLGLGVRGWRDQTERRSVIGRISAARRQNEQRHGQQREQDEFWVHKNSVVAGGYCAP